MGTSIDADRRAGRYFAADVRVQKKTSRAFPQPGPGCNLGRVCVRTGCGAGGPALPRGGNCGCQRHEDRLRRRANFCHVRRARWAVGNPWHVRRCPGRQDIGRYRRRGLLAREGPSPGGAERRLLREHDQALLSRLRAISADHVLLQGVDSQRRRQGIERLRHLERERRRLPLSRGRRQAGRQDVEATLGQPPRSCGRGAAVVRDVRTSTARMGDFKCLTPSVSDTFGLCALASVRSAAPALGNGLRGDLRASGCAPGNRIGRQDLHGRRMASAGVPTVCRWQSVSGQKSMNSSTGSSTVRRVLTAGALSY